jgi:hypothetical protein
VRGLSIDVPGTSLGAAIVKANGLKIIEGTSDFPTNLKDENFNNEAREYPWSYNTALLKVLESRKDNLSNNPSKGEPR